MNRQSTTSIKNEKDIVRKNFSQFNILKDIKWMESMINAFAVLGVILLFNSQSHFYNFAIENKISSSLIIFGFFVFINFCKEITKNTKNFSAWMFAFFMTVSFIFVLTVL